MSIISGVQPSVTVRSAWQVIGLPSHFHQLPRNDSFPRWTRSGHLVHELVLVLGISGLFAVDGDEYPLGTFPAFYHDAAACLVTNEQTRLAVEEERLTRDKHTNWFPQHAVHACFRETNTQPDDLSHIAYAFEEAYTNFEICVECADNPRMPLQSAQATLLSRLRQVLKHELSQVTVCFVRHHKAHAAAAYYDSGFENALILISDGNGERDSLSVFAGEADELNLLKTYSRTDSLGHFYTAITKIIGYRDFDEYKVMGLASYGDPSVWRATLSQLYSLDAEGCYSLNFARTLPLLLERGLAPRRVDEPILGSYCDLAAAAQEVIERITFHILQHWRHVTGEESLCLGGGVAQNTTLNGKILRADLFKRVYVPCAPHDAGAALGAAISVAVENRAAPQSVALPQPRKFSRTPYLGLDVGDSAFIRRRLEAWSDVIAFDYCRDIASHLARSIADDEIVGWAHGRSEFGPRALGNRSIFADPRPARNRDRVNALVKQRESYRPFAPVVTLDDAERFFIFPSCSADFSYMSFVVEVREEVRELLAAITHVDGTARVQIVDEDRNPRLWQLLKEFGTITDIPVLLNTSFNNFAEPIVQTVDDAVVCLLTSGLAAAAVGDYIVTRHDQNLEGLAHVAFRLMPRCQLISRFDGESTRLAIIRTALPTEETEVSEAVASTLIEQAYSGEGGPDLNIAPSVFGELRSLWDKRLVRPVVASRKD